jgi:hypothetical protein
MFRFAAPLSALALSLFASAAQAGAFTDDLSKCVVKSTTEADQKALVIWIFAVVSQHPDARAISSVSADKRDAMARQTAALMERLLTSDCRKETVAAIKYEGRDAIETAFGVLGEIAMTNLMSDPAVSKELTGLGAYLDKAKFEELGRDVVKLPAKK